MPRSKGPRATTIDSVTTNSLMWWVAIQKEKLGEAGYEEALTKAAALPKSWRALLWLGRTRIQANDMDGALLSIAKSWVLAFSIRRL